MRSIRWHTNAQAVIVQQYGTEPENWPPAVAERWEYHQRQIETLRQANHDRYLARRGRASGLRKLQRQADRLRAKIAAKERTLEYYLAQIDLGRNPGYYRAMIDLAEQQIAQYRYELKNLESNHA